jgi:hypothetical protein
VSALEINLRLLGTTHPFLALSFLTGGDLDEHSGNFISLGGRMSHYKATDNLRSERTHAPARGPIDVVTDNGLHYSHRTESGVLFHLIGALSEFGKLGLTVIANSAEVDELPPAPCTSSTPRRRTASEPVASRRATTRRCPFDPAASHAHRTASLVLATPRA